MNNKKMGDWQKSAKSISKEVGDLLYGRDVFRKLSDIVQKNPKINFKATFFQYYKLQYVHFAVSKVCHQVDTNKKSESLINLLYDILDGHKITRKWWVSQGSGSLSNEAFEEHFGKGKFVSRSTICCDICSISRETRKIKKFRNKRIAHMDKNKKFVSEVTFDELDKAIDVIEEIALKYLLLLVQSGRETLLSTPDDWQNVFTIPWIER